MMITPFTREISIDLGSANTVIIADDKIAVDEPSVVAIRKSDGKMISVGYRASTMIGHGEDSIYTVRPLKKGVITNYKACEMMIQGLIDHIPHRKHWFKSSFRMVVCVPSRATDAEMRIISDSCIHAGAKELYLIYEPIAAAVGMGIEIGEPDGIMVVDIGGGTTEIAVMSMGCIVVNNSITVAGDVLNNDIIQYMDQAHGMRISEPTAERIKIGVGAAMTELKEPPQDMEVVGPNKSTGLPQKNNINYKEIAQCLDKNISNIETAILQALEQTPSELYADIIRQGIYLTGGGALLRGLAERLSKKTSIDFRIAQDPQHSVAYGTCLAMKWLPKVNFLIPGF